MFFCVIILLGISSLEKQFYVVMGNCSQLFYATFLATIGVLWVTVRKVEQGKSLSKIRMRVETPLLLLM